MIDRLQIGGLVISLSLLLTALELVRRRKLIEEYSFIWILFSLALLAVSVSRDVLHFAAPMLDAFYPPNVLVILLIVMVFVALLCHSVIVSRQRRQIERLIEETAILAAELRDLRARRTRVGREWESATDAHDVSSPKRSAR